ncbi:response regulator [Duganella sp. FT92W]|uniref:Response regulator n=2 Tax=Pseudoduganella rivuli TaxID=2666085 RepID=A0A7X2LVG4_9BURK|nr:response regulator [Pseudoduganella rivuli]
MCNSQVLIIEDDLDVRQALSSALAGAGLTISAAETGTMGLALLRECSPDVILADLGLPDMEGSDLITDLRARSAATIIVVSARHHETEKIAALDHGADDYLTKPFGVGELLARVRAHLRRKQTARTNTANEVTFGEITVDFATRNVFRSGRPVHLTPIELKLLSILTANEGRVLTHAEMLRQAWGPAYEERPQYLRIHMAHLRQKLEESSTQPRHFLTETGVGYRFRR